MRCSPSMVTSLLLLKKFTIIHFCPNIFPSLQELNHSCRWSLGCRKRGTRATDQFVLFYYSPALCLWSPLTDPKGCGLNPSSSIQLSQNEMKPNSPILFFVEFHHLPCFLSCSWLIMAATVSYVSLKQRVSDCVFPFPFPFSPCALQWLILLLACVFLTKAIGQPNNMSNFGGRTDTWSSDSSQAEAATDKVASWKNLGTSMNAISFGFVATAILISMFLIMAILEHLIRPRQSAGRSQNGGEISANLNHQQAQLQEMGKLSNSKSMLARPPSDFSVLMPGQQYPTFLAQPAPLLPCAREEIFWPSHDHHSFDFP